MTDYNTDFRTGIESWFTTWDTGNGRHSYDADNLILTCGRDLQSISSVFTNDKYSVTSDVTMSVMFSGITDTGDAMNNSIPNGFIGFYNNPNTIYVDTAGFEYTRNVADFNQLIWRTTVYDYIGNTEAYDDPLEYPIRPGDVLSVQIKASEINFYVNGLIVKTYPNILPGNALSVGVAWRKLSDFIPSVNEFQIKLDKFSVSEYISTPPPSDPGNGIGLLLLLGVGVLLLSSKR